MENTQEVTIAENKEVVQQENTSKTVENSQVQKVEETQEQINWKKFREQREIERKQKEAAEKRAAEKEAEAAALKAAMDAVLNKSSTNSIESSRNQYEEESEDERINKKVEAALAQKERQYQEQKRQKEQAELPQKLASTYKDFNQVCSSENLDYLEYHYPEVARAFRNQPDGFEKWADIYSAVKRFVPNIDNKKEHAKAEKNFNKPQSMAVSGATQTGDSAPVHLDDKRRSDNWARMQRVMKGGR